MEIYGTEGTLIIPDSNTFEGPVFIRRNGLSEWKEVPLSLGYTRNSRGIGLVDMAYAIILGRKHRADGKLAYHVLDIMQGIHDSSNKQAYQILESSCERPAPLPLGLSERELDK